MYCKNCCGHFVDFYVDLLFILLRQNYRSRQNTNINYLEISIIHKTLRVSYKTMLETYLRTQNERDTIDTPWSQLETPSQYDLVFIMQVSLYLVTPQILLYMGLRWEPCFAVFPNSRTHIVKKESAGKDITSNKGLYRSFPFNSLVSGIVNFKNFLFLTKNKHPVLNYVHLKRIFQGKYDVTGLTTI